MAHPQLEQPDLPEFLTWEELKQLPEEIAKDIELWDGRVVWVRRGPVEHQTFAVRFMIALEAAARETMAQQPEQCWRVSVETNVFLGSSGKSDFLTPAFLVYRCLKSSHQDIRAADALLVGEVLSPSNTHDNVETKKQRYAGAGIPWYWEVTQSSESSTIATVRAYALETAPGQLPKGVRPLRPAHYVQVGEWTRDDRGGIAIDFPFPIRIPWRDLEF